LGALSSDLIVKMRGTDAFGKERVEKHEDWENPVGE